MLLIENVILEILVRNNLTMVVLNKYLHKRKKYQDKNYYYFLWILMFVIPLELRGLRQMSSGWFAWQSTVPWKVYDLPNIKFSQLRERWRWDRITSVISDYGIIFLCNISSFIRLVPPRIRRTHDRAINLIQ